MRNILILLMLITAITVACNTSTLSMSEIDIVPNDVQEKIDFNYVLQLIYDGEILLMLFTNLLEQWLLTLKYKVIH